MKRIKLNEYIKDIETHDVTLINGLKGSGKYQLMMQLIDILENTYKKNTLYLNYNETECLKKFKNIDDILKYLGEHKVPGQFLCGFSMETENMLENSRKKLAKKNLDMVVANNLKVAGAGFETDTNVVTMITDTEVLELPIMNKEDVAFHLIDQILSMQNADR